MIPKLFRGAGGRLMLCWIEAQDQETIAPRENADNLQKLYHGGVDGIVFLDADGLIVGANDAFLKLTDSTHLSNVRGRSLADFMARGPVDLRVLLDNTKRARPLRVYATKILHEFNGQVSVEISATCISDRPRPTYGLVIRDSSRTEMLRRPGFAGGEDGARSVMEQVGAFFCANGRAG